MGSVFPNSVIKALLLWLMFPQQMQVLAQDIDYKRPMTGNPVVPGFFADPSIHEVDGKFYMYSTTVSKYMEPMVWVSDDLRNWDIRSLGITGIHHFWAPCLAKGDNGKYYLYYTNGFDFKCHLFIGESPLGPWKYFGKVDDGFDLQIFRDPVSGKFYGFSSDPQSRPKLSEFDSDPSSSTYLTKVVKEGNLEGTFFDYTEGSMAFHRNGVYYLMYSGGRCHTDNYNVRYSTSRNIWGPYTDGPGPILEKDESKGIYGPGHHSLLQLGHQMIMAYHREDVYMHPTCGERQLCMDMMEFEGDAIRKMKPTHRGVDFSKLIPEKRNGLVNLAPGAQVTASDNAKGFDPCFAIDGNNATRWYSTQSSAWLSVDLGGVYEIRQVIPRFLYYDNFNLYKIEYSTDNQNWHVYADKTLVALKAFEPIEKRTVQARYMKINFVRGGEKNAGLFEWQIMGLRK